MAEIYYKGTGRSAPRSLKNGSNYAYFEPYCPYGACFPSYPERGMFIERPIGIQLVPEFVNLNHSNKVVMTMNNTLPNSSVKALMWTIGNAFMDPVDSAYLVFLLGSSGGEGKTSIINYINEIFGDSVETQDLEPIGNASKYMTGGVIRRISSSRTCIKGDLANAKDMNASLIKNLTGGDYISTDDGSGNVKSYWTIISGTNDIWRPWGHSYNKWFTRRTILLPMEAKPKEEWSPYESTTIHDHLGFIAKCISLRDAHEHPPVTIKHVIAMIFGSRMQIVTRYICFSKSADFLDSVGAMYSMCWLSRGLTVNKFISLVGSTNSNLIGTIEHLDLHYVKGMSVQKVLKY